MYYYTYLLTNRYTGMMYIGKRQSKVPPEEDTSYKGSSKYVPKAECDKTILATFSTAAEAVADEIRLHALYDVATNPLFYNRSKQTSTKFDTTGFRFNLTPEQRLKISKATTGVPKTLTPEQRKINKQRLSQYNTPEQRAKGAATLRANGANKGIKNSKFTPWYISTDTVTYLFLDISKKEKAILDGFKNPKHYVDVQRKLPPEGIKHSIYGHIIAMGSLPEQYEI